MKAFYKSLLRQAITDCAKTLQYKNHTARATLLWLRQCVTNMTEKPGGDTSQLEVSYGESKELLKEKQLSITWEHRN